MGVRAFFRNLEMRMGYLLLLTLLFGLSPLQAREWSDNSGHFKVEADLIAFDGDTVVLRAKAGRLLALKLADLSKTDVEYLKTPEVAGFENSSPIPEAPTEWSLKNGQIVRGAITGIGIQQVVIFRRDSKVHISFDGKELTDPIYKVILPEIVNQVASTSFKTLEELDRHLAALKPPSVTYAVPAVTIATNKGNVGIPNFLLKKEEQNYLWTASERLRSLQESEITSEEREKIASPENFLARSYSRGRNQAVNTPVEISQIQLDFLSNAALVAARAEFWEVVISPPNAYLMPFTVVVPAVNSADAGAQVAARFPQYQLVGISRASF